MYQKNVIDITKEVKRAERKKLWRKRLDSAKCWWDENKGYCIVIVPAAAGLIAKGVKVFGRHHNLKLEEHNKDYRCYDPSLGHYWELKRKLSNSDWVRINRRKNNGEALGDILDGMGVLK